MASSSSLLLEDSSPAPSITAMVKDEEREVSILSSTPLIDRRRKRPLISSKNEETILCPDCGQAFSKPGNRNKHIRAIHGREPELTPVETREKECIDCGILFPSTSAYTKHRKDEHGTLFCPIMGCSWRGSSHRGLGRHAAEEHSTSEKKYEWKRNEFDNRLEFNRFIRQMYEEGHLWYIRNGSNSGSEEKIEYRYCYREDRRGREKKKAVKKGKKRKGKKKEEEKVMMIPSRGSTVEKSDECCTSYMRVRWRVDGRVVAEYCIDHLAHEKESTCLPLLPEHKEEILRMLEIEDDPEEVVRRLREKYAEEGGRLANVDEEDVREVMMEEVDPFGEKRTVKEEEEEETGGTACISMEFSPSPSDGVDTSSALLALLDDHKVREDSSSITLGQLVASAQSQHTGSNAKKKMPRFRLTDNGFVFRFDKNSVGGERQFWRCERKNECAARIHTDMKGTIVKRIHHHTHPATRDPDEVVIPRKKPRINPSHLSMDLSDGIDPFCSEINSNQHDDQFSKIVNGGVNDLLDAMVKEEDVCDVNMSESMLDNGVETREDLSESGNPMGERSGVEMSEDFWRVFYLTKKVYAIVKKEVEKNESSLMEENEFEDEEVKRFVRDHRFVEFSSKLRKYKKMELKGLSVEECKDVLEDVAEGVRMYRGIRAEWEEANMNSVVEKNWMGKVGNSSPPPMRVYVSGVEEMTPIYKMITLPEGRRSLESLREGLTLRGVLTEGVTICIEEGRLTVELCDEMIEEWKDDRVFKYRRNGEYLILEPSQGL
ncbi:hypothetical protein PMAYCL1PPCAC_12242 [Pristionchus mayeri]|uniref:C2H2-type domain-containing protein n=1 Tax=Pristionchus mayeri TaxID=1317129 RepID=A0AAN5CFP1_9BILA|nr:hypothetical protein PMAYCL1PPCAC_12242 [Pristionchus mayeri]